MGPYIYGKRSEIHIIDIRETLRGLLRARKFISHVVAKGGDVLFVGTKRQARETIQEQANHCNMHYVCERWLGGTLTNFRTIRSRLQRLEELEALVDGPEWESGYSKKMKSMLSRELKKIKRNLEGIRKMSRLPGVLVVVDVRKEINAVREATSLNIPTVCMVDTDSDPDLAGIVIPSNDDAMRAIRVLVRQLSDAVGEGLRGRPEPQQPTETHARAESGLPAARRRPRRPPAEPRAPAAPSPPAEPATIPPTGVESATASAPAVAAGTPEPIPAQPPPTSADSAVPQTDRVADVGSSGEAPPAV